MLKVVKVHTPTHYEILDIEGDLHSLQEQVGGMIEAVTWFGGKVAVCDEEGLIKGLPFNRRVGTTPIHGPFLVCKEDKEGDFVGLTDEEALEAMLLLSGV